MIPDFSSSKFFTIMQVKKDRIIELIISVLILGFWMFMVMLGIVNQFNIPSIESRDYYTFIEEKQPIIIDLRESAEIQKQSLAYDRTIHLPFLFLESRLDEVNIPQNGPVLMVCSDGERGRLITTLLHKKGVKTYYLREGLESVKKTRIQEDEIQD